ncbi:hypothetical protein LOK49_LG02G00559 [Camellia lanceoleosa]|uniref:Uncharacterized protein n=1 Tax=Camellia lanceoleosa TaxID=1840588 RepID=A0ACC0INB0_9ERIC|nr:hypothetical protein LOK49_LG02G00559 [Camellia lanceoleosa]
MMGCKDLLPHKKAVAFGIFTLGWNVSSVIARIWAVLETFCTMRLHQNIDKRKEADIYSKQADRINIVNQHKLPILYFLDMSTERGNLYPVDSFTSFLHFQIQSINL